MYTRKKDLIEDATKTLDFKEEDFPYKLTIPEMATKIAKEVNNPKTDKTDKQRVEDYLALSRRGPIRGTRKDRFEKKVTPVDPAAFNEMVALVTTLNLRVSALEAAAAGDADPADPTKPSASKKKCTAMHNGKPCNKVLPSDGAPCNSSSARKSASLRRRPPPRPSRRLGRRRRPPPRPPRRGPTSIPTRTSTNRPLDIAYCLTTRARYCSACKKNTILSFE